MRYLKCLYMQPRVGESFEATISSALEFGLFVQLKEMPIDGLVHISNIPGDYWELENGGMGLVGRRTGQALANGRSGAGALEPRATSRSGRSISSCSMRSGAVPRHGAGAATGARVDCRGAAQAGVAAHARLVAARGAAGRGGRG